VLDVVVVAVDHSDGAGGPTSRLELTSTAAGPGLCSWCADTMTPETCPQHVMGIPKLLLFTTTTFSFHSTGLLFHSCSRLRWISWIRTSVDDKSRFFQTRYPSCHPTNRVKALTEKIITSISETKTRFFVWLHSTVVTATFQNSCCEKCIKYHTVVGWLVGV